MSRLLHAGRGLTLRSRRGPTAGHQARATGTVYIFCGSGLASRRWSRLTSNVRPRKTHRAVLLQNQRLSAWTEQPTTGRLRRRPCAVPVHALSSVPAARSEGAKTEGSRSEQRWCSLRRPCYIEAPCCVEGHGLQSSVSSFGRSSQQWCVCEVDGRGGSNAGRTTFASAEPERAVRGTRRCEVVAGPGCRAPSEA